MLTFGRHPYLRKIAINEKDHKVLENVKREENIEQRFYTGRRPDHSIETEEDEFFSNLSIAEIVRLPGVVQLSLAFAFKLFQDALVTQIDVYNYFHSLSKEQIV